MKRFLYIALLASSNLSAQEITPGNFANEIDLLLAGQIDSLPISHLEVIPAIQFDMVGWEFFNENEKKSTQNGGVDLGSFLPITKDDIVDVRDDHLVLLIHEKQGGKIYLASITSQGIPIESFLLHDQYGYLYEKNFRAFSYTEPVRFNRDIQAFEFYQLIYGYEPIPTLENPTQDPIYHQSFHRVVVNDQGRIELNFSEMTGNRIFRREKRLSVLHEVAFHEFSLFTVSEKNEPRSAIWEDNFITHGDMDSHDSIIIHLEFESRWEDRFFFLQPAEGITILEVSQRHENILSFPGDGTTCSLSEWNRFQSPWRNLYCEENFFQTTSISEKEKLLFLEYNETDIIEAFEQVCGRIPTKDINSLVMEPSPSHVRVVVDCIVLRIKFICPSGNKEKFIIFQLSEGC